MNEAGERAEAVEETLQISILHFENQQVWKGKTKRCSNDKFRHLDTSGF